MDPPRSRIRPRTRSTSLLLLLARHTQTVRCARPKGVSPQSATTRGTAPRASSCQCAADRGRHTGVCRGRSDAPASPPGGAAGARTPNLRRARAALSQLSYDPNTVGAPGLEPGTSALSGPRSNQLSYAPADHAVPHTGGHPPTMEKPLYNSDVRFTR